jgi:predicted transcriptional regulator
LKYLLEQDRCSWVSSNTVRRSASGKPENRRESIQPEPWTEEDTRQLRRLYPNNHNKDLAEQFNRTIVAIRRKAIKLGLKKDWEGGYRLPSPTPENAWTEKEIKTLRKMYRTSTNKRIAKRLGRTPAAVQTKIRDLGLGQELKENRWTRKHLEYLKKHYAHKTVDQVAQQLGRTPIAIRKMAQKLRSSEPCWQGARKKTEWTEQEDAILEKYIFEWPAEKIAKELNRPVRGVQSRAWKLCLLKQHRWTNQEVRKLENWLPLYSRREIAEKLGRTLESVITKQKRLGLKKRLPWTRREIAILKKYFPIESNAKAGKRLNKSYGAVIHKARELGLHKSVFYKHAVRYEW